MLCRCEERRRRRRDLVDGLPVPRRVSLRLQQQQRRILSQPGLVRSSVFAVLSSRLSLQTMHRRRLHLPSRSAAPAAVVIIIIVVVTNAFRFNGHFPGEPGLASCLFNSLSPVIPKLRIHVEQA